MKPSQAAPPPYDDEPERSTPFNLIQLHTFYLVAREGSFSAAADRLHVTQPAVSRQVQTLERVVGSTLFGKRDRRVELSEAGRTLFAYAERIDRLSREAGRAMEELRDLERGEVLLAASTTPGNYLLPAPIAEFRRLHPRIRVVLTVANSAEVARRVRDGDADLGVVGGSADAGSVLAEPYLEDEIRLVAAPGHPLAAGMEPAAERLAGETLVVREAGSSTQAVVDAQLGRWGLAFRERVAFGSSEAIKRAVAAGLGVAYLSSVTTACELHDGALVELGGPCSRVTRRLLAIVRRGGRLSRATQAFRQHLRSGLPDG